MTLILLRSSNLRIITHTYIMNRNVKMTTETHLMNLNKRQNPTYVMTDYEEDKVTKVEFEFTFYELFSIYTNLNNETSRLKKCHLHF